MHTTATPENMSVTPIAVLDGGQYSPLQAPLPAPIFSVPRTAEHPHSAAADRQPAKPDFGELAPELTNAQHEEYLARRVLDELLERGALSALFG